MKNRLLFFLGVMCISFATQAQQLLARGADVSWMTEMEASGRTWRDKNGVQKDLLDILPDYCINAIRLRVWVNPSGGWSGKQDVINKVKRAHQKGYRLMVDFHYSDSWADPGQQTKPAAWASYSVDQLKQAIANHTKDVLNALKSEGITPEWVQVGNETNDGMLWPEGKASTNNNAYMPTYAAYVEAGYQAVKSVFPTTKVVVHVANGNDNGLFRWNIGGLIANGAHFDVVGLSMYPETAADWPSYAASTLQNMQDMISRYNKDVIIAEIGLATNEPEQGKAFVEKVIQDLQSLNGRRQGVFWWEPQAYEWSGYGKVAWYGNYGSTPYRPTAAMDGFKYNCQLQNDCNGQPGGGAFVDRCGTCVGGLTGKEACGPTIIKITVNMSGVDVSQGVYITGSFTQQNGNWQLLQMTNEGNNIYSYQLEAFQGDTAAYYFLNANNWTARETVPVACQVYWSDRGYTIEEGVNVINHVWGSCEEIITSTSADLNQNFEIYPNPFNGVVTVYHHDFFEYELLGLDGTELIKGIANKSIQIGEGIEKGVYLLKLKYGNEVRVEKIFKE